MTVSYLAMGGEARKLTGFCYDPTWVYGQPTIWRLPVEVRLAGVLASSIERRSVRSLCRHFQARAPIFALTRNLPSRMASPKPMVGWVRHLDDVSSIESFIVPQERHQL
jgi:hypothetical protein